MLPSSNLDQEASHWLCAKCGTRQESNDVESILEGKKAMADMVEKDHGTIPDVIAELGATLHPNHYIIFDLKETYVSSSQVMLIILLEFGIWMCRAGRGVRQWCRVFRRSTPHLLTNSFPLFILGLEESDRCDGNQNPIHPGCFTNCPSPRSRLHSE